MSEKSFVIQLGPRDRIRHRRSIERGQVRAFTVQYEARFNDEWESIVRYDTAHGFAHRDILHPDGHADKQKMAVDDLNAAYTWAAANIRRNWQRYREQYARESKRWKKK